MVAMVVTNTIKYGSKIALKEGMETNDKEDEETAMIREKLSNLTDDEKKTLESFKNGDTNNLNLTEEEESMFQKMIALMNDDEDEETSEDKEDTDKKEGMKEGNKPALKPKTLKPKSDKVTKKSDPSPAPQGKRNLKTIEKETMDVRNKQKELMTSMKSLEPMLTEAQQFMENFKKK